MMRGMGGMMRGMGGGFGGGGGRGFGEMDDMEIEISNI